MTWFEELTGCTEASPESVRQQLKIEGKRLYSLVNQRSWLYGDLEVPTLAQLRERTHNRRREPKSLTVREVVGNVQHLHRDSTNKNSLFQVASQFNLLEMTSPSVTPERGIGIYERDYTQGPACAIAAGAGTIYRNYFVEVEGGIGQTATRQINCLAGIESILDNSEQRLWQLSNGYALPSANGLAEINRILDLMGETERDSIRQALRIGLQWETQVTLNDARHTVSQAYCSAMPVAYTRHAAEQWKPLATLILEAAYEATICAAIVNADRTGNNQMFLTLLGGGAFGNSPDWIISAIRRSLELYSNSGIAIAIVSFGASKGSVRQLAHEFSR